MQINTNDSTFSNRIIPTILKLSVVKPKVINGFSDLMVEIFGEKGKHARSAVGMISLPNNMAVEIEMIVEVEN
jgi:enamine deaminase RidA (YjgF/YER057c/UK114 family)